MSAPIMERLKADELLKGSHVLYRIKSLRDSLSYDSDERLESFDDHFLSLQAKVDGIKKIRLLNSIPVQQSGLYENELISCLEEINDSIESLTIKLIRFQGDLQRAVAEIEDLRATFEAWYTIEALAALTLADVKLTGKQVATLATSEYNRLMGNKAQEIATIQEAVKIELRRLEGKKKMAKQKFDMGREQVNAAWGNKLLTDRGISPNSPQFQLLEEEEDLSPKKGFFKTGTPAEAKAIATVSYESPEWEDL